MSDPMDSQRVSEQADLRLTVWEHLVTDLTDDGTTSAGYTLADIPHDVLRGYVVDASGAEARVSELEAERDGLQALVDAYRPDLQRALAAEARVEAAQEAVVFQAAEWMNFHEAAMADPFAAEREVMAFCRRLAAVLSTEGGQ